LEITIRFIISKDFNKLQAFSKFLESKKLYNISFILNILSIVADDDVDDSISQEAIRKVYAFENKPENIALLKITPNNEFEKELILISCLYYNPVRINKEEFLFLDKKIKEIYKEHVLFEISLLLFEETCNFRWEKLHKFDNILNTLKESKDYELYYYIIKIKILNEKREFLRTKTNNSWSEKYSAPMLEDVKNESNILYNELIEFNNLNILSVFLISYMTFLSNQLWRGKEAIDVYLKTIIIFENNNKYLREEVELKMHILTLFCRTSFIKNHKEKAKEDFKTINDYFQKRFKKNTFNKFARKYLSCKIKYLKETANFIEMEKVSKYVLDLTRKNMGKENHLYAEACGSYADALRLKGEGEKSLKWYENRLSIKKILLDESDYTSLQIIYYRLAFYYIDFDPKNHEKILLYAKTALDLSDARLTQYSRILYGYANALAHIGKYQESYTYCQKSIESLNNNDIDDKEIYFSDINILAAIAYSKIDIQKAIPMLDDALKNVQNLDLLDQKRIEEAKGILNKNKK